MIGQPGLRKPPAPLAHRHPGQPQLPSHPRHTRSRVRARQDNPRPLGEHRRADPRPAGKLGTVILTALTVQQSATYTKGY
jgi:hypothetical protein